MTKAAKTCPALMAALGLWKSVDFNYESTDTLNFELGDTFIF